MDVAAPSIKTSHWKSSKNSQNIKALTKIWKLKPKIIPAVIGALGMIKKGAQISLIKYLVSPLYKKCQKLYLQAPLTYSEKSSQSKT